MASRIREVWADNLDAELVALREALGQYPVVSMYVPFVSTTSSCSRASMLILLVCCSYPGDRVRALCPTTRLPSESRA